MSQEVPKNPTVLVVENSAYMRERLKSMLQAAGCEVIGEAATGLQGLEAYRRLQPDLVTMDIVMPREGGMDGYEAMRAILEEDPSARVVMVSALDQRRKIESSLEAGASDFLVKPLQPERVVEMLDSVFGRESGG